LGSLSEQTVNHVTMVDSLVQNAPQVTNNGQKAQLKSVVDELMPAPETACGVWTSYIT